MLSLDAVLPLIAALLALYAAFVLALLLAGRRCEALALVRFVPDCIVLFRRLLADRRVSRSRKLVVALVLAYLAVPLDLVPDFIPLAGQLDDAIVVAVGLRFALRAGGPGLIDELWPGPAAGARLIVRLAFGSRAGRSDPPLAGPAPSRR
jgi:uncharacterized membrane protein YkvA (DUF1232 family)